MRRLLSFSVLLSAVVAQVVLVASPASAYEVRVTILGAGTVTETTDANLLGTGCTTSANNPTGTVGKTCLAGTPSGDYGWGWAVDYVATPKSGYRFLRWEHDGTTRAGVICDRSSPPGITTTYTGSQCKFTTYENLQVRAVFVDDTAPAMSSLNGPNQVVNGATTFTFSASADPTVTGFECRVANVHDWVACSSGRSENPPTSGTYTFEVRAVDASGNNSAVSTWNWTVDKVAPETTLSAGPAGLVNSTAASFEFSSNEQGAFRCALDGGTYTSCGSPKSYAALAQGQHSFSVRAVDVAGNQDGSPVTRTWTVDTVAPETTIMDAPDARTNQTSASFAFVSSEPVNTSFVCTLDGSPRSCEGPYVVGEGDHLFTVAARDAASNTDPSASTHAWTVDTTRPTVKAHAPTDRRVSRDANASVAFSEAMWEATVEARRDGKPLAFYLTRNGSKVAATIAYRQTAGGAFRAVLDPLRRLRSRAVYRAVVVTRAKDLAGNGVVGTSWKFRTRG